MLIFSIQVHTRIGMATSTQTASLCTNLNDTIGVWSNKLWVNEDYTHGPICKGKIAAEGIAALCQCSHVSWWEHLHLAVAAQDFASRSPWTQAAVGPGCSSRVAAHSPWYPSLPQRRPARAHLQLTSPTHVKGACSFIGGRA